MSEFSLKVDEEMLPLLRQWIKHAMRYSGFRHFGIRKRRAIYRWLEQVEQAEQLLAKVKGISGQSQTPPDGAEK